MQVEPPEISQNAPFVPFVHLAIRLPLDGAGVHSYPLAQFTLVIDPSGDGVEGENE